MILYNFGYTPVHMLYVMYTYTYIYLHDISHVYRTTRLLFTVIHIFFTCDTCDTGLL